MSVNKVILLGRIGKDPVLKYTPKSVPVLDLSLATSEKYKGVEKTEWHSVVFWNKQAEVLSKYTSKGSLLYVEGKIQTRDYDAKDGSKRYKTEIIGTTFDFVGSRASSSSKPDNSMKQTLGDYKIEPEVEANVQINTDDIPF